MINTFPLCPRTRSEMFVFAVILASANAFGDAFTSPDSLLPGHDYKTIKGADWLNCLRTCIAETRCLSYNYFKATNGQDNICEMNDRAMDNSCDAKGHLISSPGWLYNQVKRNVKVNTACLCGNLFPRNWNFDSLGKGSILTLYNFLIRLIVQGFPAKTTVSFHSKLQLPDL